MIYLSFNYKKYMTKNKSGKKDNRENKPKKNKAKRMKKEAMLHSVMSCCMISLPKILLQK